MSTTKINQMESCTDLAAYTKELIRNKLLK